MAIKNLTLDEIKNRLKIKEPNLTILSTEYTNKNDKARVRCEICEYEWDVSWRHLFEKNKQCGCGVCSGKVVSDKNRLSIKRPELIKYLVNKEDGKNYSYGSHKKIYVKCPDCNEVYYMMVSDLTRKPFCCKKCSDSMSKSEKFMREILKQLDVEFYCEKTFDWIFNRRYDFYIPSLNMIIETHGDQHYRETTLIRRSLQEEQDNDRYKKETALKNGIKNYIEVECRKSDYKYLKAMIIKSLKNYFNFENIDFIKAWEDSNKSMVIKTYDLYKQGHNRIQIGKILNIDRKTVSKYLNIMIQEK